jgi:hypothetical protein
MAEGAALVRLCGHMFLPPVPNSHEYTSAAQRVGCATFTSLAIR